MKITKIVLATLLGILAILAGALAYVPVYLGSHKELIEAGATRMLGRPVAIQGSFAVSLIPVPSLSVQGLQIRNPEWAQHPLFARAERLELQLDLRALVEGRIRIARVLVNGGDVQLEQGPQGQTSWSFGPPGHSRGALPVDAIEVLDSRIGFTAPQRPKQQVDIPQLDLQMLGGMRLALAAVLSYRGIPFSVSATTGSKDETNVDRWPFSIQLKSADSSLQIQGSSAAAFDASSMEASFGLRGEDLQLLENLFSFQGPASGPFGISGRITRQAGGYRIADLSGKLDALSPFGSLALASGEVAVGQDTALAGTLEGTWGQVPASLKFDLSGPAPSQTRAGSRRLAIQARLGHTSIRGKLRLQTGASRPRVSGELRSDKIDVTRLTRGASVQAKPPAAKSGREPWTEQPLPLSLPGAFDADITLAADLISTKQLQIRNARVHALLENGRLRLENLNASLPGLPISGYTSLDAVATPPLLELSLSAARAELPLALSFLPTPPSIVGDLQSLTLRAKAQGDTAAALLKTLDGTLMADAARIRVGDKQAETRLEKPTLVAVPGKNVTLKTDLTVKQQTLTLSFTSGPLADLLTQKEPWPAIEIAARGKLDREDFEIRGEVGPLAALLAGRNLRIDLTGQWQGMKTKLKGTLARLDGQGDSRLAVQASGGSLFPLGRLFGTDLPKGKPFDASARLEGDTHRVLVRNLKAKSANSDIAGDLRIRLNAKPEVAATLSSHTIDLTPYLGKHSERPATVENSLSQPLPLNGLQALDGALGLEAGHVRMGDFGVDDAVMTAMLDSGNLHVSADAGDGRLIARLEIRPEGKTWKWSIKQQGKLNLGWLIEEENQSALSKSPSTIDVRLAGVGNSLQELLGSANGRLELAIRGGLLNKKVAHLPLGGIVVSLMDALRIPSRKALFEGLKCAVLQFDVKKGIATSTNGLALQTETINAIGSGALNLGSGEIELHFKATERKGVGISLLGVADQFVYITGTLSKPEVAVDRKSLVVRGGAAWATSGLSLLYTELAERLTSSDNPCDLVLGGTDRRGGWWSNLRERL